jgi:hypothetical protein
MAEGKVATDEVAKSRRGLFGALAGVVVVALAGTGVAYSMGLGPFASEEPEVVVQPAVNQPAEETTVTPVATSATVPLPPADAQEAMYWEQVASAEQINNLVTDKFEKFELSQIATSADKADIRVAATYRDGTTMSGWLLLRQYEGAWYFTMITADGNEAITPDLGDPDADVVKAIVEQQAANQDVYTAILDGTYDTMTITRVTQGSGTAMADVMLSKGSGTGSKAQITFIKKEANGTAQWFITAFSN